MMEYIRFIFDKYPLEGEFTARVKLCVITDNIANIYLEWPIQGYEIDSNKYVNILQVNIYDLPLKEQLPIKAKALIFVNDISLNQTEISAVTVINYICGNV